MKKLFLGALALMFGAIGFAQDNHTTVRQNGTELYSEINQFGYDNTAKQFQNPSGTSDNSLPGGVSEYNDAFINQFGSHNTAHQRQIAKNDLAESYQVGILNESYQDQESGFGKEAYVYQEGNENKAWQTQTNNAGSSVAYITQYGLNNSAKQWQEGAYNKANLFQDGGDNISVQRQFGVGTWDVSGLANVTQYGWSNYGFQYQGPDSYGETANLYQDGNGNESWQRQYGDFNVSNVTQWGNSHDANTNQAGNNNVTNVYQSN